MPKISSKFDRSHPLREYQMQVGWVKIGEFPQITGYISRKRYKIDAWFLLKSNRKSYVLYRMVMSECFLSGRGQGHVSNFYIVDLENFATARRQSQAGTDVDSATLD